MPPPIPRHGYQVHVSLTSPVVAAFPASTGRSARASPFSRLAQRSLTLRPACSPSHLVTLYTEGFSHFVTSMTAPIATGRSERGRAGFAPAGKAPTLHGARRTPVRLVGSFAEVAMAAWGRAATDDSSDSSPESRRRSLASRKLPLADESSRPSPAARQSNGPVSRTSGPPRYAT